MKEIKFGIFGEDEAHQIFLQNYFKNFKNENISFNVHEDFYPKIENFTGAKKKVFKNLDTVAKKAYSSYYLELLIVVIDCDKNDFTEESTRLSDILDPLIRNDHGKSYILCIPVRCIEHWFLYLTDKKLKDNSIETLSGPDAKKLIYGHPRFNKKTDSPKVENLSKTFPIKELIIKSKSFLKFHTDVEKFCKNQVA